MSSGYACPVCDAPQRDGEHLANHLAFTAMLRGEEHEEWLDEHVPDWASGSPDDLAERVVEFADAAEYEEVFEDTVHDHGGHGRSGGHDDQHDPAHGHPEQGRPSVDAAAPRSRGGAGEQGELSGEAAAVLEEARRMTEEMYEDDDPVVEEDGSVGDASDDETDAADTDDEGQES
ncbi:DUF5810 domain-containing protein [Halobium salinum]|uniref:DUF5810 domain-containing protein n=1 Tax=Halobium salinum TaxID=1364940 RepID=A0ABD5PC65_9EURY|nr:DUF5810 domain-containing protein [Halobium salinum]